MAKNPNNHAGIELGHVEQVADEAVQPLGLAQGRSEQLLARRVVVAFADGS